MPSITRLLLFQQYPQAVVIIKRVDSITDDAERLLQITRYFFAGWFMRPKGVKKPFNPILGEFHRCEWKEEDGTDSFYICEQVSHHPPISAFFYCNAQGGIVVEGELRPKAKFFGNSAGTIMEGGSVIKLKRDLFNVNNPNIYARSLLFGTMYMELGDTCEISSPTTNLSCQLEFKQRGMFGGVDAKDADGVKGKIFNRDDKTNYFKISGTWKGKTVAKSDITGKEVTVFDTPKQIPARNLSKPLEQQEEFESGRLEMLM